ncbi:hypothetical protein BDY24DRAFT_24124 [Mrakia frigida]|uniref:uncharacterized protein n=1 Tax=Mrakia frigida TaxID=29902 RepID=UPI003FCC048D
MFERALTEGMARVYLNEVKAGWLKVSLRHVSARRSSSTRPDTDLRVRWPFFFVLSLRSEQISTPPLPDHPLPLPLLPPHHQPLLSPSASPEPQPQPQLQLQLPDLLNLDDFSDAEMVSEPADDDASLGTNSSSPSLNSNDVPLPLILPLPANHPLPLDDSDEEQAPLIVLSAGPVEDVLPGGFLWDSDDDDDDDDAVEEQSSTRRRSASALRLIEMELRVGSMLSEKGGGGGRRGSSSAHRVQEEEEEGWW